MRLLFDTHLLLWAAGLPDRLPKAARAALEDTATEPVFSVASLWEVAIKHSLGRSDFRADFRADPHELRRGLLENGYSELPILGPHALAAATLPPLHADPFDRMLVAQAQVEAITLMTSDAVVARYPGPVQLV